MDKKIEFADNVNIKASIVLSKEEIEKELNNEAKRAAKSMRIDGFRKGKVPVSVVMQRYKDELIQESKNTLLKRGVDEVLKDHAKSAKDLIGEPFFDKFEDKEGVVKASFVASFKPEVKLGDYESLIPELSKVEISDEEVNKKLDELLKNHGELEAIKEERGIKTGDFVKFDFEGYIDDKPFEGGKAAGHVLEIGSGQFIPGFEDGMLGLKVGEERDVKVTFPKEYGASELAGKDAVFKVKIHEILLKKLAKLDEDLLKTLLPKEENPSKELLIKDIKTKLADEQMYKEITSKLRPELTQKLVENIDFELPLSVVEQETDLQFRSAWQSFEPDVVEKISKDEKAYEEKREEFKQEARNSVKLTFIIDALANDKKITVSDNELMQAIYFEAYSYGIDPREYAKMHQERGTLGALRMGILENKLFAQLFKDKKPA